MGLCFDPLCKGVVFKQGFPLRALTLSGFHCYGFVFCSPCKWECITADAGIFELRSSLLDLFFFLNIMTNVNFCIVFLPSSRMAGNLQPADSPQTCPSITCLVTSVDSTNITRRLWSPTKYDPGLLKCLDCLEKSTRKLADINSEEFELFFKAKSRNASSVNAINFPGSVFLYVHLSLTEFFMSEII